MEEELKRLGIEVDLSLHLRMFALVLARVLGMAQPLPFLGGSMVPARIRFGLPLLIAVFLYPHLTHGFASRGLPEVGLTFMALLFKELFVGFCVGFIASLPFHTLTSAGSFMDTQRGTTFAQVIAPTGGGMTSLIGQMLSLLYVTFFLSIGGMGLVLEAFALSYQAVPMMAAPATMHPEAPAVEAFIRHTADTLTICAQISAPVVVSMLLTDVTLGIVNRTAPNVQVFFLGMGIKSAGGLLILFFVLGTLTEPFVAWALDLRQHVRELLAMLTPR